MGKNTPGPWRAVVRANQKGPQMVAVDMPPRGAWKPTRDRLTDEDVFNARLIAAAPDYAMFGWAICVGGGRWEPWGDGRGEFCMNGMRHATKLDEFGVPEMTDAMRAAIRLAHGEQS